MKKRMRESERAKKNSVYVSQQEEQVNLLRAMEGFNCNNTGDLRPPP